MAVTKTFDYIIVGGGSAGCVLANRLSEQNTVLLVEAGPGDKSWKVRMPAATALAIADERRNWHYETEPQVHLNNRRLIWPRGRMLGGCSSHNLMVYIRGHAGDYDHWRQLGCGGWAYRDVLPYFKRAESFSSRPSEYRGHQGPMQLKLSSDDNPLIELFIKAVQEAGFPRTDSFSASQLEGVGRFDLNIISGNRLDTGRAYLWDIMARKSLSVELNAYANRLIFEGTTAVGLEYRKEGWVKQARASREIIVCAGAINTPQLLMLSGIGDPVHLAEVGIAPLVEIAGVGKNLQDHLDVAIQRQCTQPVTLYKNMATYRRALIGLEWLIKGTGQGATGHSEAGAFLRINESADRPEVQNHFLPTVIRRGNMWPTFHGYQINVCQLRQESRGFVKLRSSVAHDHPIIEPNYLQMEADVRCMREGVKLTREIMGQPAFDSVRGDEIMPGDGTKSDEDIDAFVRKRSETCYHPCGTSKMGSDSDETAVVDPALRVRGVDQLRIADASIMPTIISANLNATAIMIGEKAADLILGRAPLPAEDVSVATPITRQPPARLVGV